MRLLVHFLLAVWLAAGYDLSNPPYANLTYGKGGNYLWQMRALLNQLVPVLEIKACFPNGTYYGAGFGGVNMLDSELVFLMGGLDLAEQKVLSLRMTGQRRQGNPNNYPQDSPVYKRNITSCGDNMVQFLV